MKTKASTMALAVAVSNGYTLAEARATSGFARIIWEEINKNQDNATIFKNIRTRVDAWVKTLDTATLAKIRSRTTASVDDQIMQNIAAMTGKWFQYFISFDPQPYQKSGSPKYDMIELPGLNHLFQTCIKCSPAEYGDLEATFSPTALAIMDDLGMGF